MSKLLVAAITVGILASSGSARSQPNCYSPPHTWVLLGLDVNMGRKAHSRKSAR